MPTLSAQVIKAAQCPSLVLVVLASLPATLLHGMLSRQGPAGQPHANCSMHRGLAGWIGHAELGT